MKNISIKIGDLFKSGMQTQVNTVNCVGVMGKGIAAIFKKEYPEMFEEYRLRCDQGQMKLGEPYLYRDLTGVSVVNFPTKGHWRASTRLADVEAGLDFFVKHAKEWGITSVAFPPLGCGNGGLEWRMVGPLMVHKLKALEMPVEIYAPYGTPVRELDADYLNSQGQTELFQKGKKPEKLRPEWAALVEVLYQLQQQPYVYPVGRTIFQKICYILTRQGLDTGFRFERNSYGPFASEVKEAIGVLANSNWLMEEQIGRMTALRVGPAYEKARKELAPKLADHRKEIDRTVDLFSRIKNTDQAEEVATVIFSVQKLKSERAPGKISEMDLLNYILDWKKAWKDNEQKRTEVADSIRNLEMLNWFRLTYSEDLPVGVL